MTRRHGIVTLAGFEFVSAAKPSSHAPRGIPNKSDGIQTLPPFRGHLVSSSPLYVDPLSELERAFDMKCGNATVTLAGLNFFSAAKPSSQAFRVDPKQIRCHLTAACVQLASCLDPALVY